MAEHEWKAHRLGIGPFEVADTDNDLLRIADGKRARDGRDLIDVLVEEAVRFMKRRPVQQQIDRVARALLERTSLTAADVREISEFSRSFRSRDF